MLESLSLITSSSLLQPHLPHIYMLLILTVTYITYRCIFNGMVFKTVGQSNTKLKNIGRPLPAYPNGWYIAARSYEVSDNGQALAVDIAGQNLVVFRSLVHQNQSSQSDNQTSNNNKQVFILEAYCKHLGANLGIGGKIVNKNCVQCPFHGWLYSGKTGLCVDYDGKPIRQLSVQYNDGFSDQGNKLDWIKKEGDEVRLRKYPSCEVNGYIYVWIHSMKEHQDKPQYPVLDIAPITKNLQYRSKTIHEVQSHIQDIPQNGSDMYHFKFVHTQVIPKINFVNFLWRAKWRRGDDPQVQQIFEHKVKYAHQFKQKLYKQFVQPFPDKKYLSIGYIDNFINIPVFGINNQFMFNVTIIQLGCSLVYIFLKSPIFTIVFFHFVQPKQKYKQIVYHQCYSSKWIPYWASALAAKMEGIQVTNDMHIWDRKKFGRKVYFKKGQQADQFLKSWRQWYSQYYEGCLDSHKERQQNKIDW